MGTYIVWQASQRLPVAALPRNIASRKTIASRNITLLMLQHSRSHDLCAVTELVWERPLTVLNYPDPRLRAPNARIGVFDDRLRQLAAEMFDVMYR